jgi:hypothetical protein
MPRRKKETQKDNDRYGHKQQATAAEDHQPSTPQDIIEALKTHRGTLSMMLYKVFKERQKHKLGSHQVQSMGLLLSEMEMLLLRLERKLEG